MDFPGNLMKKAAELHEPSGNNGQRAEKPGSARCSATQAVNAPAIQQADRPSRQEFRFRFGPLDTN
jgi:hypothetical protein